MTNGAGRRLETPQIQVRLRPANDDFAAATMIPQVPFAESFRFGSASEESGELAWPDETYRESVWWEWIAPSHGVVLASSFGRLSAFTGESLGALRPVQTSTNLVLRLEAQAGTIYHFRVARLSAWKQTPFTLTWPPSNDDFVNRVTLSGDDITLTIPNIIASLEPREPLRATNVAAPPWSMWWSWTAPATGAFLGRAMSLGFPLSSGLVDVFNGDAVDALTRRQLTKISSSSDWFSVRVQAGETLQLAMNAGYAASPLNTNAIFHFGFLPDPQPRSLSAPFLLGNGQFLIAASAAARVSW